MDNIPQTVTTTKTRIKTTTIAGVAFVAGGIVAAAFMAGQRGGQGSCPPPPPPPPPPPVVNVAPGLTATLGADSPLSTIIVGGTQDAPVLKVHFTNTDQPYTITKLRIKIKDSPQDDNSISAVGIQYTKQDQTIETITSAPTDGIADFSDVQMYIPTNGSAVLNVYADFIPVTELGISGDTPAFVLDYNDNFEAVNQNTAAVYDAVGNADIAGAEMIIRKTKPTVIIHAATPSGAAVPGLAEVLRFTVTADAAGDLLLDRLTFRIDSTANSTSGLASKWNAASVSAWGSTGVENGNLTRSDFSLYAADDLGTPLDDINARWNFYGTDGKILVGGNQGTQGFRGNTPNTSAIVGYAQLTFATPINISAGISKTLVLKVDTAGASSAMDDTFRVAVSEEITTIGGAIGGNEFQWDEIGTGAAVDISGNKVPHLTVFGGTLVF